MNRIKFFIVAFILFVPFIAQANPLSFHDEFSQIQTVVTETGGAPDYWGKLYFPTSQTRGTYSNGVFEYDNYLNGVTNLKITLNGRDEDGNQPIDMYVDFDSNHTGASQYQQIASFTQTNLTLPGDSNPFKLVMDVLTGKLILITNVTTEVGILSNISKNSFVGYNKFWIGYGCHFDHTKSEVDVTVNPVPEPATMLLLGSGLLGLAGYGRKKFFKK